MPVKPEQLLPVVQSFRTIAHSRNPPQKLAQAMGKEAWSLQVDKATQDFQNYLTKTVNRIIGTLEKGGYAPRSALQNRPRALDSDDGYKKKRKNERKADKTVANILGLEKHG